jgi:hypothetical protein
MPKGVYSRGPAQSGRRLAAMPTGPVSAAVGTYVCGAKPLKFAEFTLTEGVEVPGADKWSRLESWIEARRVRKLGPDEQCTSFVEFTGGTWKG